MHQGDTVPLHAIVLEALHQPRSELLYNSASDFLFPSIRLQGTQPLSPDSILKKSVRPALKRAGIVGKQIGWQNLRHSLATDLRASGVDIKVTQKSFCATQTAGTTLDI